MCNYQVEGWSVVAISSLKIVIYTRDLLKNKLKKKYLEISYLSFVCLCRTMHLSALIMCSVRVCSGQHKGNKQAQCGRFNPSEKHWWSCHCSWSTAVIRLSTSLTCLKGKILVASARITLRTEEDLNVGQTVCVRECVGKGLQAPRGPPDSHTTH